MSVNAQFNLPSRAVYTPVLQKRQEQVALASVRFQGEDALDFLDDQTLQQLSAWVDKKADGVIERLETKTYDGVPLTTILRGVYSAMSEHQKDEKSWKNFLRRMDPFYEPEPIWLDLLKYLKKNPELRSVSPERISHGVADLMGSQQLLGEYNSGQYYPTEWGQFVLERLEGRKHSRYSFSFWSRHLPEFKQDNQIDSLSI